MATKGHITKYQGGLCYAACQDTFAWWNPITAQCWKGCDFAVGRVNDPKGWVEAREMCKQYTAELVSTDRGELENIEDLRVNSEMYPTNPVNIYKACLAGLRRQQY